MKITEKTSNHDELELMKLDELLFQINQEDQKVAKAVSGELANIEAFILCVKEKMMSGGRLFYIGAGTSGRLGVLDASECPPTFGVDTDRIVGIIAGGDGALRVAQEGAEDDLERAMQDLEKFQINKNDVVLGIASSGSTPYVLGGLMACQSAGIASGGLVCNPDSAIATVADFPIEVIVGPEFITGSTRMKAGSAQKMVLNMISTSLMIQLGKVKGNKMVDMKLSNSKLKERGLKILIEDYMMNPVQAELDLEKYGSVRGVISNLNLGGS